MEFEVFDQEAPPANSFHALKAYLQAPRRQMQVWGDRAPHVVAAAVFGLVVVEWVLSQRLWNGLGRGPTAVAEALQVALLLFCAQFVLAAAASAVAALAGKTGRRRTAMAYLSLGLVPLLLVLPVTLICEATNAPPGIRAFAVFLLGLKVLSLWRGAIETVYRLNGLQSAAVYYISAGTIFFIGFIIFYAAAIVRISAFFS